MLFGGTLGDEWEEGEPRLGRFIFIGKNLNQKNISDAFLACKAKPLRFSVGQKVFVNVEAGFTQGKVIRTWDEGQPYRVQMDNGVEVWAPEDIDAFIKEK